MNARRRSRRGGFTLGDAAVLLSLLCLAAAVVFPRFRRAAFDGRVALAVADVDALGASARAHLAREGAWPADAPEGAVPEELAAALPPGYGPEGAGYAVDWNLWETLSFPTRHPAEPPSLEPPAPDSLVAVTAEESTQPAPAVAPVRHLAGITIHSAEEALLAQLLQHYGTSRSFLREGSWTLILPGPG